MSERIISMKLYGQTEAQTQYPNHNPFINNHQSADSSDVCDGVIIDIILNDKYKDFAATE